MVNDSYVLLSWSPIVVEGWNISHYYLVYHTSNLFTSKPSFSSKFKLDGHSRSKSLHPADLLMKPSLQHVFELSAVLDVRDLEGMGEVRGEVAQVNRTFNSG